MALATQLTRDPQRTHSAAIPYNQASSVSNDAFVSLTRHAPDSAMNAPHDTPTSPTFPSRLPNVGTTIFTVMSALAAEKGAVNLGQGFPDFNCDPRNVEAVGNAMRDGHNQ